MAAFYQIATVNYDGDGQLKLFTNKDESSINSLVEGKDGEWFVTVDGDTTLGVIYAPETDNYAAAVLEFTT